MARVNEWSLNADPGIKSVLRDNLRSLIAALDSCTCPSTCNLSADMHAILKQTVQIQQENGEAPQERARPMLLRQLSLSVDFNQPMPQHSTPKHGGGDFDAGDKVDSWLQQNHANSMDSESSGTSSMAEHDEIDFHVKKGFLYIINNIWFDGSLHPRNGAGEEGNKMKKLFESFGFEVEQRINASRDDINDSLKYLATTGKLEQYDCFALLMMSHGSEEGIHGTDSLPHKLEKIMEMFKGDKCKSLRGKPKLFFFQSCRGKKMDRGLSIYSRGGDVVHDGDGKKLSKNVVYRVPTDSDILMVCATTEGRFANRTLEIASETVSTTSWFLDAMQQIFMCYADKEDVSSMMLRINRHVALLGDENMGMQVPCQFSTLTKRVFFSFANGLMR